MKTVFKRHLCLVGLLLTCLSSCSAGEHTPPDFAAIKSVQERKAAFFNYLEPIATQVNTKILEDRNRLLEITETPDSMGWWDRRFVVQLAERYGTEPNDLETLLRRVDAVPVSLLLAQAANESNWGRSRFATKGKALFGQWCFKPGCGMVPKGRPAGETYEVRSFSTYLDSVKAYVHNLNTGDAYRRLRDLREQKRQRLTSPKGVELAEGLSRYSTRGEEYVKEIQSMIRFNKLDRFDDQASACAHTELDHRC